MTPLASRKLVLLGVLMAFCGSRRTLILLTMACVFTLNASAAPKRKRAKVPAKQEQPTPAPAPVAPPTPVELTLEQSPAVSPRVTYQNHELTIVAENSTLGDILRAVKTQTGASIDFPANANSRVVTHLGPGPSRDVLAKLLNGTLFNYVLMGTVNDPSAVGKIILTQKPSGSDSQPAVNPAQPDAGQPYPSPTASMNGQADPDQEPDSETAVDQPDQPEVPPVPPNEQTNPRTPEQLLQELQRQQQLQQQLQQQQANPNQAPPQNPEQ